MAVKIEGVQQELSAVEGVLEDVPEIVLNIKGLVLRLHPDEEKHLRVTAHGPGPVTAANIEPDPDVDVVRPDQLICTLTKNADFTCDMVVRKGRGYVPFEELEGLPTEIGTIPVDALFSPVQRVSYRVEDTRVGRKTNYDRLTLQIYTNGIIGPEMALVEASKIMRKHLNPFAEVLRTRPPAPAGGAQPLTEMKHLGEAEIPESKLSMPLSALGLTTRAAHCLESEGIHTVKELLQKSEKELLSMRNFGQVSLEEVVEELHKHGLEVGLLAPAEEGITPRARRHRTEFHLPTK